MKRVGHAGSVILAGFALQVSKQQAKKIQPDINLTDFNVSS
jgi:hypothetical protein